MKARLKDILYSVLICLVFCGIFVGSLFLNPYTPSKSSGDLNYTNVSNPSDDDSSYKIYTNEELKAWLTNNNGVQEANPIASLANDITLDWGNTCAPNESHIRPDSTLNGKNFTITLAGVNATIGSGTKTSYFSLFSRWHDGTIKNVNIVTGGDVNFSIHNDSSRDNTGIFTGLIFSQINCGIVSNCNIEVRHSIYWNNLATVLRASNHFGVVAGELRGNTIIENTSVKQLAESTITVKADNPMAVAFIRIALICSDSFKTDAGTPLIKNLNLERWGRIELRSADTNYATTGGIYGAVVADMQRSGDGGNHDIQIDGVIYNGLGADLNNNVLYKGKGSGTGYLIGRRENGVNVYSNFYSYVALSDENSLKNDGGVTYIPEGYTLKFDKTNENNVVLSANNLNDNQFIWSLNYAKANELINTYTGLSKNISIEKHNADKSLPIENIDVNLGVIKNSAKFGFASAEATYNGNEFYSRFNIEGQIITSGYEAEYFNNLNSINTTGEQASVSLIFNEREDGVFLKDNRYFVYKNNITEENIKMTIKPAPLKLIYTVGDIYTNSLKIEGLVNGEELTIEGTGYDNETIQLNCLRNSTHKTIEFSDKTIQTNYQITKENIDDNFTYIISPHKVKLDEGITISGIEDTFATAINGELLIFSKNYKTINLQFEQSEGYLNRAKFITSNGIDYDVIANYDEENGVVSYVVQEKEINDFQYLNEISLIKSLKKVAIKLDINDESLLESISLNSQSPIEFGDYLVFVTDYKAEVVLNISLKEEFLNNYEISVYINGIEQIKTGEGCLFEALGDENNIMNVVVKIVSKS